MSELSKEEIEKYREEYRIEKIKEYDLEMEIKYKTISRSYDEIYLDDDKNKNIKNIKEFKKLMDYHNPIIKDLTDKNLLFQMDISNEKKFDITFMGCEINTLGHLDFNFEHKGKENLEYYDEEYVNKYKKTHNIEDFRETLNKYSDDTKVRFLFYDEITDTPIILKEMLILSTDKEHKHGFTFHNILPDKLKKLNEMTNNYRGACSEMFECFLYLFKKERKYGIFDKGYNQLKKSGDTELANKKNKEEFEEHNKRTNEQMELIYEIMNAQQYDALSDMFCGISGSYIRAQVRETDKLIYEYYNKFEV